MYVAENSIGSYNDHSCPMSKYVRVVSLVTGTSGMINHEMDSVSLFYDLKLPLFQA